MVGTPVPVEAPAPVLGASGSPANGIQELPDLWGRAHRRSPALLLGRMQGEAQRPRSEAAAGSQGAADARADYERTGWRSSWRRQRCPGIPSPGVVHGEHRRA